MIFTSSLGKITLQEETTVNVSISQVTILNVGKYFIIFFFQNSMVSFLNIKYLLFYAFEK